MIILLGYRLQSAACHVYQTGTDAFNFIIGCFGLFSWIQVLDVLDAYSVCFACSSTMSVSSSPYPNFCFVFPYNKGAASCTHCSLSARGCVLLLLVLRQHHIVFEFNYRICIPDVIYTLLIYTFSTSSLFHAGHKMNK